MNPIRCPWCGQDPLYTDYHDTEWGVPEWNSRALWEKLILDGFQAGLAWITILRKREAFRAAFEGFDPLVIASWGEAEVARLLADAGIVRHRGKIEATIGNARAFLAVEEKTAFSDFLWKHVDGRPVQNRFASMAEVPTETAAARALSKELRANGFRFCGPTITYAFMQATGMVNDHLVSCAAHDRCARLAET
ncbi:DNA-3-methyladenine glycosylase I [Cereibacter azotoformans]|uniref:DNA-3-methyladenine glycosylase I n=1 Tax=Cereibacter sphaeroides (strain ATCC 17025 / ATH 2.4.3) TaxID=349102 RepID=A4WVD8_CERS5|nr:DNA-3-methyladenine glycosylase I [Cereibacter azotoformans]ULB10571.1 DNA-3-methyladenine glycosylase I [Cereibacter azotoformans]